MNTRIYNKAKELHEILHNRGIECSVGIAENALDGSSDKLHVYCRYKKDLKKIPHGHEGFEVVAKYVGKIVPL